MIREDNDEREEQEERPKRPPRNRKSRRKRFKRRRRRRNPQFLPVLIAVALIVLIGGILVGKILYDKYSPSKELADTTEYFQLTDDQEIAILYNNALLEDKGRLIDNRVYLDVETVYQYVNPRFYWDATENLYLYALPTELVSVGVGSNEYTVSKAKQSEDYIILRADGEHAFVALDFVNKYTNFTYEYWEDPNHVHIVSEFGNKDVVTAQKKTQVRYQAGIKSPILTTADKGTTMYVLEESEDIGEWTKVLTKDGYIGYVRNKQISSVTQETVTEPEFSEPVYSNISKDYTINLSWHQVTNQDANENIYRVLADTKGLTTISPTWFFLSDNDGGIESLASQEYVNHCHQNGVEVWGLVEDIRHKDTIKDLEIFSRTSSRQKLVSNLIAQAIQYDLDGINLDMEFINEESARAYIEFVRELSIMCRLNGIVLSIDNYVPAAHNLFYNRKEQGIVADYVIIMGYDEHFAGGEAGSVASYPFVKSGIENTLKLVPKEKVINAVPFFTRVWTENGDKTTSSALGLEGAAAWVEEKQVELFWDEDTGQSYGELETDEGLKRIWLEDAQSLELKMDLIRDYDLAGVACWKLGFEPSSIWDVVKVNE